MTLFLVVVCFLSLFSSCLTHKGVDISNAYSESDWRCLLKGNWTFMVSRAWHSFGTFDSTAATNIKNAKDAGYSSSNIHVYLFPCRSMSAKTQMDDMINDLKNDGVDSDYGRIWLDLEMNPSSGCSWTQGSIDSNCDFIIDLVTAAQAKDKKVGIYSSYYEWGSEIFFGDAGACSQPAKNYGDVPLWYADFDGEKNFDDFKPFGGWTQPKWKQYNDNGNQCGINFDKDYHP